MPKIQWTNLPPALRQHLFDRLTERKITTEDLYQLNLWRESNPGAPEGKRYKEPQFNRTIEIEERERYRVRLFIDQIEIVSSGQTGFVDNTNTGSQALESFGFGDETVEAFFIEALDQRVPDRFDRERIA